MVDEALRLGPQYTRPAVMFDRYVTRRQAGQIQGLRPLNSMGKSQREAYLQAGRDLRDALLEWPYLPAADAIWELRRGEASIFYPLFQGDPTIWVECPSGREHLPGTRVTTDYRGECSDCGYDLVGGSLTTESEGSHS
jgi:hypothetical protein